MIINKNTVDGLFQNLNVRWQEGLTGYVPEWQKIAMKESSTSASELYTWYGRNPAMKRWVGEKTIKSLKAYQYTLTNEDFEATIEVDRNDIKDDRLGGYGTQAQQFGQSAAELPDTLILDEAANNVFVNECYDGQPFVDTDHPMENSDGSVTVVSNKVTPALSSATEAAAIASLGLAMTTMQGFLDTEGKPLKRKPTTLMVPPALMYVALKLATHEFLTDGSENPFRGMIEVFVNRSLTDTAAWYVLDTSGIYKPFVLQEREPAHFVSMTDPNSENVFSRKKFLFGNEGRATSGYSFWQLIVGSDGTT